MLFCIVIFLAAVPVSALGLFWPFTETTLGPLEIITQRQKAFDAYYNSADYDGVQAMYYPEALMIDYMDPTGAMFYNGTQLAAYFASVDVPAPVTTNPVKVFQESPSLIHELGQFTFHAGGERTTTYYYMRWAKDPSIKGIDSWKIA